MIREGAKWTGASLLSGLLGYPEGGFQTFRKVGVLGSSPKAWEVGIITQFIIEGYQRTQKGAVLCTSKRSSRTSA